MHIVVVKYNWSSTQILQVPGTLDQVQVQVLCIFGKQVLKYIKYWHVKYMQVQVQVQVLI